MASRLHELTDVISDRDGSGMEHVVWDRWYRDPTMLRDIGPALAGLFDESAPTVIVAAKASGYLLGPLVAQHLGVGFVRAMKDPGGGATDSDRWRTQTAPPDYLDRHLSIGWRSFLVTAGDRVLCVDDIIETGTQVGVIQDLVIESGATWIGAAVAVDAMTDSRLRRDLGVRSLVLFRDL